MGELLGMRPCSERQGLDEVFDDRARLFLGQAVQGVLVNTEEDDDTEK